MYEKTFLHGSLERVFEVVQVYNLLQYLHNYLTVVYPLQSSSPIERENKIENYYKVSIGT